MPQVKTRQGFRVTHGPYPLNEFPLETIQGLAKRIAHLLAIGHADIGGDFFAKMFADTIGGDAYAKPLGVADVRWNGCAWSVKTVKNATPHRFFVGRKGRERPKILRLISGRNSPTYSSDISDTLANPQSSGDSVVQIYNERIMQAREEHDDVRLLVCVRNMDDLAFTIFERSMVPLAVNDYRWKKEGKNLWAYSEGIHVFTWQSHGSQFTIKERIPESATRFVLRQRPGLIQPEHILRLVRFKPEWVEIVPAPSI